MMCFCITSQSCSSLTVMWSTSAVWRTGIFSLWQHRVRDPVLNSGGMAAATTVWSRPGQVAPVTLHRPCRTKHCCVYVIQLPPMRNLLCLVTLTWPEGQLMYTAWQCPLSAVLELQATVQAMHELQTLMFRDHLFYFHTQTTIIVSSEWQRKWVYFSEKPHRRAWCHIMHFATWSYFINKQTPLFESILSVAVSSCTAAVISFSHASQHWYRSIDYDLNVCFLYGGL